MAYKKASESNNTNHIREINSKIQSKLYWVVTNREWQGDHSLEVDCVIQVFHKMGIWKKNIKCPNPKDNWLLSVQNLAEK